MLNLHLSSTKKINKLSYEISRLLRKSMSNMYSEVTEEKNWSTQKLSFLSLKSSSSG